MLPPQLNFTRKAAACPHTFIPVCAGGKAVGMVIYMEQLMKHITLIDTLGIFLPGAIFVLAVNFYNIWDVAAPWKALLGDGDVPMLIYFVGLSYLCGSVIHQLSAAAEQLLMKVLHWGCSLHAPYWEDPKVQNAYRAILQKDPPGQDPSLPEKELQAQRIEAGREIFRTVRQRTQPQQMILFDAFYTMSRALVLTLFCVVVMALVYHRQSWRAAIPTVAVCVICIAVFFRRWVWYEARCIDEAYRIFLTYPQTNS